jgi:hypothetical protein
MSTLRIGNLRRGSFLRVLGSVAAAVVTLLTGCKDSNDVSGTMSPASPATVNVAGTWTGTFTPAGPAFYAEPVAAQATLQQTGSNVDGTIEISGSSTVTIHATVSGAHVSGTVEDGSGTAMGGFVAGQLSMQLRRNTLHPTSASWAGQLALHR